MAYFDNFFPSLRVTALAISAWVVTGCATTTTTTGLTKTQCEQIDQGSADWQTIGMADGLMGRDSQYFSQHLQSCGKFKAKNAAITPLGANQATRWAASEALWETGRQQGIVKYCTPLRAYQLGREGYSFNNVCPTEQMVDLLKANDEGLYNYQRQQDLRGINSWDSAFFPFGWGYGYAPYGYASWGYTDWGYAGQRYVPVYVPVSVPRYATPHPMPHYVPAHRRFRRF